MYSFGFLIPSSSLNPEPKPRVTQNVLSTYIVECGVSQKGSVTIIWGSTPHNSTEDLLGQGIIFGSSGFWDSVARHLIPQCLIDCLLAVRIKPEGLLAAVFRACDEGFLFWV